MARIKRQIITIDDEKCDGCGNCVPACVEGAVGKSSTARRYW